MDIKKYVTYDENGKAIFDETAFNADLDRERNNASETARTNTEKKLRKDIEAEIRGKIESEAKLTAEQKLEQERLAFEQERKQFNKDRIIALYQNSNLFSDEEIETFSGLITDNYEESVVTVNKLIEARKKRNETYEKDLTEKIQAGLPRNNGGESGNGGKIDTEIAKIAKSYDMGAKQEIVEL